MRLLALLFLPAVAFAETPLTLGEVLERALAENPTVGRAELSRDIAASAVQGANGVFDPRLTASGTWGRSQQRGFFQGFPFKSDTLTWDLSTGVSTTLPTGTTIGLTGRADRNFSTFTTEFGGVDTEQEQRAVTARTDFSLTQPLLRGAWTAFNLGPVTRARNGLTVSELTLERTRQEILSSAATAYWNWWYQNELARIADDSVTIAEEALRVGRLQVEAGNLAPVERTRLEAAMVQARSQQIDAQIAADQAADQVLLLIGMDPSLDVLPATQVGAVPTLDLDVDAIVASAMTNNLDVAIAKARLEGTRQEQRLAKHARLPALAATFSTGIGNQQETAGDAIGGLFGDESFPYVTVGGTLEVPLGNRAARADVQRTGAEMLQSELDLAEAERRVASEVTVQVARLQSAQRKVDLADYNLRLAEETLAAEEALADAGRTIQRNVLEARTNVDSARVDAARSRTDWRLAQVELLRLQGGLQPRDAALSP